MTCPLEYSIVLQLEFEFARGQPAFQKSLAKLRPPELVRTGPQTIYLVNLLVPRMEFSSLRCCFAVNFFAS